MKIIVVSHGELANALIATAQMLAGRQDNVYGLALESGESTEDFLDKVKNAMGHEEEETLFLCDLFAGTPFNVCSVLAHGKPHLKVMFGINLPLLLEAVMSGADKTAEELATHLEACSTATIGIGKL